MVRKNNGCIQKLKEKLDMYDMIIANLYAGNSIIEPSEKLDNARISIGFSNIASETSISKYFMISGYPDWVQSNLMDSIRRMCLCSGVKINYYIYTQPYKINWDSAEMKNKVNIWKRYAKENENEGSVFDYRMKRDAILARKRIIKSTKYLNESELDNKRTLSKVSILIEFRGLRDDDSILGLTRSIKTFKEMMNNEGIKYNEIRVNMLDWMQALDIFCLRPVAEVNNKIFRKIMTDDLIAMLGSYKQGRIGEKGECLGMDVYSKLPVLYQFKEDPDAAENMLICAETGGGKSYFAKHLLTYFQADGFVITVMDYEGDEYSNYASFIRAGNPDDVIVISMGKGSTSYFDSMEIPELTGDPDIDDELKEQAMNYTLATFRLMVAGTEGNLTKWEESVVSTAIKRVYEDYGVTDDKNTWHKSKGLNIKMVYDEVKEIIERQDFVDETLDNVKHKAAMEIVESCKPYFEEGEVKSGTFKNPISADTLFKANLIVFSFGVKGATNSSMDPVVLALKQLSVANISTQISNHCKYVRHCFNVKVWEEYQRWGDAAGSAEIIGNAMTGGRKRGDVNLIITNDLNAILDDNNPINSKIRQNITAYAVGKIKDKGVIRDFCSKLGLMDIEGALQTIRKVGNKRGNGTVGDLRKNRFNKAFCVVLSNGDKAIVKVSLPKSIEESKLFKTGVDINNK